MGKTPNVFTETTFSNFIHSLNFGFLARSVFKKKTENHNASSSRKNKRVVRFQNS